METACVSLRPRVWLVRLLCALLAVSLLSFAGALVDWWGVGLVGLQVAILVGVALYAHVQEGALSVRAAGTLVADERGLTHAAFALPREQIVDGYFRPARGRSLRGRLRLEGRAGRLLFEAELDEVNAGHVLRALRLDASQHRAQLRIASPLVATVPRQAAVGFLVILLTTLHLPVTWWLAISLAVIAFWPAKITAGSDGLLFQWLFWRRFVSSSAIRGLGHDGDRAILVERTSGRTLVWHTSSRRKTTSAFQRERRDLVLSRIRAALEHGRSLPHSTEARDLLARAGRSTAEWLAALREQRGQTRDYRASAVPTDELWRVLEDPAAPADARAAAAFVLHGGDKIRLQNAAKTTASPRLRFALEAAAEDDEAELDSALARQLT